MKKRENTLKKYLMKIMGTRWDAQSHEDSLSEGIPDLSYGARGVNGWIELKQIESWPKKPETPAKPKKYTPEQVNWLIRRGGRSHYCFILIKVGKDEYFLFDWSFARSIKNGMTKDQYHSDCLKKWDGFIEPKSLLNLLTSHTI